MEGPEFLSGVIEGFYGRPWSFEQRATLLSRLRAFGFNTYVYAPKDDIKLRTHWRESYGERELGQLAALVQTCHDAGLRFVYSISPGLDVSYGDAADLAWLIGKVDQLLALGVHDVALLLDDIPDELGTDDRKRFDSLAAAQGHLAEALFEHLREVSPEGRKLLGPTIYCRRMADQHRVGWEYLRELGGLLGADVDVFWTGDEVVSESVDAASLADVSEALGRPPLLWDNLHADDYDLRSVYLGPYSGRSADLPAATRGILTNPNGPFQLNEVAFATLAAFLRDPDGYRPESALGNALAHWHSSFGLLGGDVLSTDELWLLAELFYLPWRCGPGVQAILDEAQAALSSAPDAGDGRLARVDGLAKDVHRLFERLAQLRDRELFYSLHGVALEARRESRVLADYLLHRAEHGAEARFGRPDQLPNTYRRGFAAAVHHMLPLSADGSLAVRAAT